MFEVGHLNSLVINICAVRGVKIVQTEAVSRDRHGAMHSRHFGVVNPHVRTAAHPTNTGSRFRQSMLRIQGAAPDHANRDGPIHVAHGFGPPKVTA